MRGPPELVRAVVVPAGGTPAACLHALTRAEMRNPETLSAAESGYLGRARVLLARVWLGAPVHPRRSHGKSAR